MATNDFKPFAISSGANVTSQDDYEDLTALSTGFQSGKASSAQVNKAIRQATVMAYVLAQFISDSVDVDVLDDGNPDTITANLKTGIVSSVPGSLLNVQTFSASGTYTPIAGTKKIRVKVWGAGGGGGGMTSAGTSVAGAAGGYAEGLIDIEDVSTVSVTIGQGGASVAANSSAKGGDGGSTLFGTLVSCTGGKGGVSGGANPSGGIPTGGNILNITGQGGQGGSYYNEILNNGAGGASYCGYNSFPHLSSAGDSGSFPGGGGAMGSYSSSSTNYGSGAGANGLVIIEEYS